MCVPKPWLIVNKVLNMLTLHIGSPPVDTMFRHLACTITLGEHPNSLDTWCISTHHEYCSGAVLRCHIFQFVSCSWTNRNVRLSVCLSFAGGTRARTEGRSPWPTWTPGAPWLGPSRRTAPRPPPPRRTAAAPRGGAAEWETGRRRGGTGETGPAR